MNHDQPQSAPVDKPAATLQARAALAGFQLVPLPDGSFVISKWSLVKALPDACAVVAFLAAAGVPG